MFRHPVAPSSVSGERRSCGAMTSARNVGVPFPPARGFSRRDFLCETGICALGVPFTNWHGLASGSRLFARRQSSATPPFSLSAADEQLLDEIQQACFRFFWEAASPSTGLVKDRSAAGYPDDRPVASIASTGFGLTGLCIAAERGWQDRGKLADRARACLNFLLTRMYQNHGFFFHFVNMHTGEREFTCEVSSIDTSILLCGILSCRAFFDDPHIHSWADELYQRVDWNWMLNGGTQLSHGWKPESGFLRSRWDTYNELMMIYLLGLGSPTHPLPAESWDSWARPPFEYDGIRIIGSHAPLFVHQYSHAWFDFRNQRDGYANYFENSVLATRIHKLFCLSLAPRFPDYSEDLWGITASDSPHGYVAWGGPPPMGPIDGSVVPSAAGGSVAFLPADTLQVLRTMRTKYAQRGWKRYAFVDAFNPLSDWYDPDVIGINLGIILLMAENLRSGFVWRTFMSNEEAPRAMSRAGFHRQP
jgi:hypothetical protein